MALSKHDVAGVAHLARLQFAESELDQFTDQLGKIVSFVEKLNEVETDGIEPMSHPLDVETVVRADSLQSSLGREQALQNAPNADGEFFLVPPVLG
ncbi:MAG: Asp-tRNA(Asn)/Glu-tRNA(Gln) amidotransferase subunit GatC [Planctomycetota bacterium]